MICLLCPLGWRLWCYLTLEDSSTTIDPDFSGSGPSILYKPVQVNSRPMLRARDSCAGRGLKLARKIRALASLRLGLGRLWQLLGATSGHAKPRKACKDAPGASARWMLSCIQAVHRAGSQIAEPCHRCKLDDQQHMQGLTLFSRACLEELKLHSVGGSRACTYLSSHRSFESQNVATEARQRRLCSLTWTLWAVKGGQGDAWHWQV